MPDPATPGPPPRPPRVPLHERPHLTPPALPPAVQRLPAGPRAVARGGVSYILDRTGILPAAAQREILQSATHTPPPPTSVRGELFRLGGGYRALYRGVQERVLLGVGIAEGTSEAATGRGVQENVQLLMGTTPAQLAIAAPLAGRASTTGPPAPGYPPVVPLSQPGVVGAGRVALAVQRARAAIESGQTSSEPHIAPRAPIPPARSPLTQAGESLGGILHTWDQFARQPVFPDRLSGLPDPPLPPQAPAVPALVPSPAAAASGPPAVARVPVTPPLHDPRVLVPPDPALSRPVVRITTYTL